MGSAYIDVGATRKPLKSHVLDLSHLTWRGRVANCIPLVTTASSVLQPGLAGYPQRLHSLGSSEVLHVRGQLSEARAVAIVGARAATVPAMRKAHALAKHLGSHGVHVVSGGAIGIDGAAHEGALASGTTAVFACGIDVVYPDRHADLFDDIVLHGGALVSMFPAGMKPRRATFVRRNAMISALADAVIVVEADVMSGSLSTARAARQQGRILAAYPGSPGCERLLATGAALVESGEDVLALLDGKKRERSAVLDEDATRVRNALSSGAFGVDAIVRYTGLPVPAVLRALSVIARLQ